MATHKPVIINDLFGELQLFEDDKQWFVIHTKPRCEKKLANYLRQHEICYYLPQFEDTRTYQRRKVSFTKVLFPGYIFAGLNHPMKQIVNITGYIVGYISVKAQVQLLDELLCIHGTKAKKVDIKPGIWLGKGLEVLITEGPLKGMKGVVESHTKLSEVRLQVSILRQAVLVSVPPEHVKILGEYEIVEQET